MNPAGTPHLDRVTAISAICFALLSAYVAIQATNIANAILNARAIGDTPAYARMASQPIWSPAFLGGERPFTVPLVYKLLGMDPILITAGQATFSMLSWSLLAARIGRTIRSPWLKRIAVATVLLLSLNGKIIGWNSIILSESISLSLMALFLASWLQLLSSWGRKNMILLMIVAFFWAFSRETNAWVILMIAGTATATAFGAQKQTRRRHIIIAAVFAVFFCANEISSNAGRRWVFPFLNVFAQRILPYQEHVSFFARCGMPVSPQLTRMSGQYASSQDWAFYNNPALEEFRVWLHASGKSCYLYWLLSRPYQTLSDPLANINEILTFEGMGRFSTTSRQLLAFLLWSASMLAAGLAIAARVWRRNPTWTLVLPMCLLVYPHAFLVWHGDAMDIGRHSLQVGVQFYLGIWIFILLTLDDILAARGEESQPSRPHSTGAAAVTSAPPTPAAGLESRRL